MSSAFLQKTTIGIYLGIVLVFYLWTASSSGNPFKLGKKLTGYYNLLSDAFLAGQLSLLVEPRKELLALPDPYDPSLNERWRLHDASLYKGKYYLSWGPTPALTLFVPFRLIFHRYLDENLAVALFCFGGLVWSILLLNLLTRSLFPGTPFWMRFAAIFCLSLSNVAPYILRRPLVYEAAISSGYFFLFGGLYWLASGDLRAGKARLWRWLLGSLFLGLAAGSRPHFMVAGVLLLLLWVKFSRDEHTHRVGDARRQLFCLFAPYLVCIGLLGLYNYARFESWTEFGMRYALAGINQHKWKIFEPNRILPDLYFYFLSPSRRGLDFPFFHLAPSYPWTLPKGYYGPEPVAGILSNIPFLNILLVFPLYFFRGVIQSHSYVRSILASFLLLALALASVISALSATMRYVVDFVSLLLLPALLLWFHLDEQLKDRKARRVLLRIFSIGAILYGCFFNLAISMIGAKDLLRARNPETYKTIERAFVPLQRTLATVAGYSAADYGPVALRVQFPQPTPERPEPLVVTGRKGAGDFVLVKYLGNGSIALAYDHWGRGGPVSRPIRVSPDEIYDLEIHMGSLYPSSASLFSMFFPDANYDGVRDLLLITLNGAEVLRDHSNFYRSKPSEVTIGRNTIGGGICADRFSGEIVSSRRALPASLADAFR